MRNEKSFVRQSARKIFSSPAVSVCLAYVLPVRLCRLMCGKSLTFRKVCPQNLCGYAAAHQAAGPQVKKMRNGWANGKSFQSSRKFLFYFVIIFLLSFIVGCTNGSEARTPANERDSSSFATNKSSSRPIEVNAVEVKQTTSSGPILIPASITVEDVAEVLSQRNGVVVQMYAQEGQRVSKGSVLVQLSNDDLQSQLQQAALEVSRLKVEEKQYLAAVNLNRTELEREKVLFKENVSSQSDVERAQFRLDQATQEYEKIRIATQAAQARVEAVKVELEKIKIRAPIDGVIIKRQVSLGSNVAANQKLFELSRLAPLKVKFQLPQTSGARLNIGETISLSSVSSNQIIASARISRIAPVADATNYTFGYIADVIGGNGLMPGVAVNVNILPSGGASVVYVPLAAFPRGFELQANSTATLLIIENNRCVERTVTVQGTDGDQAIISNGLLGGDKVIIAAPPNLKTGDVVIVK
jgi:membrane fusion protein (multidrug efflux system)